MDKCKTIFVTISRGALIRNFFHTGVISGLLDAGHRVVILSVIKDDKAFDQFKHENLIIEQIAESKIRLFEFFQELGKGAVFNKVVYYRYKHRIAGRTPKSYLYPIRMIFFAPLRVIPFAKRIIWRLDYIINPQTENDYLFEKYKPDLVFATSTDYDRDVAVLKSAKRFGVKSAVLPKSWDNLPKYLFPTKADYLLVWNDYMKNLAVNLQGYRSEDVYVTGVPQFDFYHKDELRMERDEFCKIFDIDPNKKIILYASSGGHNLCDEHKFIPVILDFINSGKLKNTILLVRPHLGYHGDVDFYRAYKGCENYRLDNTAKPGANYKDAWDTSNDHIKILFNSIYHTDVLVNIASTITLDGIACGTPVINLFFDLSDGVDFENSVRRLHGEEYVRVVTHSGATWLVKSREEFLQALQEILVDGKKKNTKDVVDYFLYKNDGHSARRIVEVINKLLN